MIDTRFVNKLREVIAKTIEDDIVKAELLERTTPDELLEYLQGADSSFEISSFTFSYFTEVSLGISLEALHGVGDHLEFELKYQDIKEFINVNNEIWNELLK
jgi:hypothetical protein